MIDEKKLIEEFTKIPDRDWYTPWIVDVINAQPKVNYPLGDCVGDCKSCWKTKIVTDTNVGSKWIPCSERLPEKNKIVLCWVRSTTIASGETFIIGSCDSGFWFLQTYEIGHHHFPVKDYKVIAWQPLPEPYKGE